MPTQVENRLKQGTKKKNEGYISLNEASEVFQKSVHTLRGLKQKGLVQSKKVHGRLFLNQSDLVNIYEMVPEEDRRGRAGSVTLTEAQFNELLGTLKSEIEFLRNQVAFQSEQIAFMIKGQE